MLPFLGRDEYLAEGPLHQPIRSVPSLTEEIPAQFPFLPHQTGTQCGPSAR